MPCRGDIIYSDYMSIRRLELHELAWLSLPARAFSGRRPGLMSRLAANALLLLAAALWGAAFIAQADAGHYLNAGWFTGLRFVLAFLVVLPLGLMEIRRNPITLRQLSGLLPLAAVFAFSMLAQQWGLAFTSVTHAGFLTGLYVVFVPLIEVLWLRRLPHPLIWLATIMALAGTWFLGGGFESLNFGDLLIIISAFGYSLQILLMQKAARGALGPVTASLTQSAGCVLVGCSLGAIGGLPHWLTILHCWPELVYGGAVSGGIAFLLQAICQRYTGATDAAVMMMSEALFAAFFAALLLHERMGAAGWFGCSLIFGALVLAQIGPALIPWRRADKLV